jgi:hypothetical protein
MWKISMVLMLRSLIGDLDSTKYTDTRLEQILSVGAYNVVNDADFSTDYTVDVAKVRITPDPVSNNDGDFVTLTVYKSACILLGSEVKTESGNAISIKDGPSAIDLRGISGSLLTLYRDICAKYDDMLLMYSRSNTLVGQAILGPYSPGSDFAVQYQRIFGRL